MPCAWRFIEGIWKLQIKRLNLLNIIKIQSSLEIICTKKFTLVPNTDKKSNVIPSRSKWFWKLRPLTIIRNQRLHKTMKIRKTICSWLKLNKATLKNRRERLNYRGRLLLNFEVKPNFLKYWQTLRNELSWLNV